MLLRLFSENNDRFSMVDGGFPILPNKVFDHPLSYFFTLLWSRMGFPMNTYNLLPNLIAPVVRHTCHESVHVSLHLPIPSQSKLQFKLQSISWPLPKQSSVTKLL